MKETAGGVTRRFKLIECLIFVALAWLLKFGLDPVIWRYSGPVSLAILLLVMAVWFRRSGQSFASIGLLGWSQRPGLLLMIGQIVLAFIAIGATGVAVGLGGEWLGLEFMRPDNTGSLERFGDLAGNTPLYLTWLPILWIAGPAEEVFFRGYLISALARVGGETRLASFLAVVIAALYFGFGHVYYQGLRGLVVTGAIAVSMGLLFLLYRRNLWPLMIAHALFNTLVFTALYKGWDI